MPFEPPLLGGLPVRRCETHPSARRSRSVFFWVELELPGKVGDRGSFAESEASRSSAVRRRVRGVLRYKYIS